MNYPSAETRRGCYARGVFVSRKLLVPVFFFLLTGNYLWSSDLSVQAPDGYSYSEIKGFMNHLALKGEYDKARLELYRLRSFFPLTVTEGEYQVTEACFLFHEKRYGDLMLKKNLTPAAGIYRCDAFISLNRFTEAVDCIRDINRAGDDSLAEMVSRRMLMLDLVNERYPDLLYQTSGLDHNDIMKLYRYSIDEGKKLKKPWLGAALGVCPGAGYMYSDEIPTGIVAAIVISGLSALTYYSFRTDNRPLGIFLGAAAVFFYGGSILGGYRETVRFNNTINENRARYLEENLHLQEDREMLVRSKGLVTGNEAQ